MATTPRGIQHIGVPVKDLDTSLAFYKEIFGLEPEFVHTAEGRDLARAVDVPDAKLTFTFLQLGNTYLELLEYHTDRDENYDLRNCDVGAVHICFEVDDIQQTYQELLAKGVDVVAGPLFIEDGPLTGYTFVYFRDPDGITLELFELPADT